MKRFISILFYLVTISILFFYKDDILESMKQGHHPFFMVLIATCFAIFPIIPYSIVIGIIGFVYGTLWGAIAGWAGAFSASIFMYLIVRYFFYKQGRAILSRYNRLEQFTKTIESYPFLAILLIRLIPIFPQYFVTIYAAVTTIPFRFYVIASAIGKIPGMLVLAFIGGHLFNNMQNVLFILSIYAVFLVAVYIVYYFAIKKQI